MKRLILVFLAMFLVGYQQDAEYDILIRNGMIYDGTGSKPYVGSIGIKDDRIGFVGMDAPAQGKIEVDADGLAVAPGFINMLSWAIESLIIDGRSQSDIRQGVTLEVFGEGWTFGPANKNVNRTMRARMPYSDQYEIEWTTQGEYLEYLENKGISCNVASFIGATSLRIHEMDHENRPPTEDELNRMRELVQQAMEEGALGVGSSLIYAPAF